MILLYDLEVKLKREKIKFSKQDFTIEIQIHISSKFTIIMSLHEYYVNKWKLDLIKFKKQYNII